MKNSPKHNAAKAFAGSERSNPKRTSRSQKKTVLTIAPIDAGVEHFDAMEEISVADSNEAAKEGLLEKRSHRLAFASQSISPELATTFSCKLMSIALQLRTWTSAVNENASIQEMVECSLDGFEEAGSLTTGESGALPRLHSLLNQLHRDELAIRERNDLETDGQAKQVLTDAVHAVIAALSQRVQFDQAVESASQRAIYQFAYGLTHEINNPLANIVARAQQLIASAPTESDRRSLATIVDQSMRAHEMLAEMMRVVQPRSIQPRTEDIVAIVRRAVAIQEQQRSHAQIQCHLRVSENSLYCSAERASITEAICSVLQNALQVCRPNDRIEIRCEAVTPDHSDYGPSDLNSSSHEESVPRIRIAIRDTGLGMSCEAAERAFDLYFSGREHGRGLGISLANVRRTIEAHGGLVWIQSAPNAGCTVEIRLPKSPEPPSPRKAFSI